MLSGWLSFEQPKFYKYLLHFDNFKLYVESKRKFTTLSIKSEQQHIKIINNLGIDILTSDFTEEEFKNKINKKKMKITSFLLNQHIFSGIGNYIKSESLYLSKINPHKNTKDLTDKQINKLYKSIKYISFSVLHELLIDNKLKIPSDIKKISPTKLQIPYKLRVYGRTTDLLGNKITIEDINGRTTYFVDSIQL